MHNDRRHEPALLPEDLDPETGGITHRSVDRLRAYEIAIAARRRRADDLAQLIADHPELFAATLEKVLAPWVGRFVGKLVKTILCGRGK
jgi:hypothetical protein